MPTHDRLPGRGVANAEVKKSPGEETLKTESIRIERKSFIFALKENPRGRFLRITEDVNGRRDAIIIPAAGLEHFTRALDQMTKRSDEKAGSTTSTNLGIR